MKKNLQKLALVCSLISSVNTFGINRYVSTKLSCNKIHDILADEGAAILRWKSSRIDGLWLYDRFVAHGFYCFRGEVIHRRSIPAMDTERCRVRFCDTFHNN